MSIYSQAHICQCLTRISTLRHNATVTITETRRKTGEKFVADVLSLAGGLVEVVGLKPGDVVAISALNRYACVMNAKIIFEFRDCVI